MEVTSKNSRKKFKTESIYGRTNIVREDSKIHVNKTRDQIGSSKSEIGYLDNLPFIDRSLVDYKKYHNFVGHAGRKNFMALQATRGCPYKCFYCDIYKTTVIHYRRSVDNIIEECKMMADFGIKRIEFIDDIFNVNLKHCTEFFEKIIQLNLKFEFMFPTGLKGDLLTFDLIDLMFEGGARGMNLSLEHPSPRLQSVMRKNLNVPKFKENLDYIVKKYPEIIIGMNTMHGFPTETEEEAYMTLNFIKDTKYIHFPYMFNVRVFPGTELEHFALESGIPKELIEDTQDMSYEEGSPTIPFSRDFTKALKTIFLKDYVLNKERLLHVLPHQMRLFTEDELDQKYSAYFPSKINSFNDLLKVARIKREELSVEKCLTEDDIKIPDFSTKLENYFPKKKLSTENPLNLLLIDLSTYYVKEGDNREYNVVEPPLGLMALTTFINSTEIGKKVNIKIIKSFIDFNSDEELLKIIYSFKPDLIGFRTMTFYRQFFHNTVKFLRENKVDQPIIVGGPYATASYVDILKDTNIDLAVIAEGELTLKEILYEMLNNNFKLPSNDTLLKIQGIAFRNSVN